MFYGSIVALVTPFDACGELDIPAYKKLLAWHLQKGTKGIVIAGTTGESPSLTSEERDRLLSIALETTKLTKNKIPVIMGTGTNVTATTIKQTQRAKELGADGCLIVTPYYNRPTQEGLYKHFLSVANEVSVPIILYNVPKRTGCDLKPETIFKLTNISANIIAVKEATGDVSRLKAIQSLCDDKLILLSGDDCSSLDFMCNGGSGVISVTANIVPDLMAKMCDAVAEKQINTAKKIQQNLGLLHKALAIESNPIPVKWILEREGKIQGKLRLPLTTLAKRHQSLLIEAIKASKTGDIVCCE